MSKIAIRLADIGKKYQIGRRRNEYRMLRQTIVDGLKGPFQRAGHVLRGQASGAAGLDQDFWALRDITFDVEEGEVVGIIGRNGAGKSTLLKILARVTDPTTGYADIYGRVGALLEVGTGFHSELTGRENVFLNGAILGMPRREIINSFDEIVEFAEFEEFIDTPVKHYSSGMRLRLAFSVAAHLDPEILIVDEVLAVGDASFRKKSLNRMEEVGKGGRTVLFVSHNMQAVTRLCSRVIHLEDGRVVADGPAQKVVPDYLGSESGAMAERVWLDNAPGDDVIRLVSARVRNSENHTVSSIDVRQDFYLEMVYDINRPDYEALFFFELFNEEGTSIFTTIDNDPTWVNKARGPGRYRSTVCVPRILLQEGAVFVSVGGTTLNPMIRRFHISEAMTFQVIVDGDDPDPTRVGFPRGVRGAVRPMLEWHTEINEF